MSRTIIMEDLPSEVRRTIEQLVESPEPVILSQNGEPVGELFSFASLSDESIELDDHESAAVLAAIRQGEEDYTAGRSVTLEEFLASQPEQPRGLGR